MGNYCENIRRLREAQGMSQGELAERVLTTQAMISKIEAGVKAPGVELFGRIADVFGCSMDELKRG